MQLFICDDFIIQGEKLIIREQPELVRQLRKVLRAAPGYHFWIQRADADLRYEVELEKWTDSQIFSTIIQKVQAPSSDKKLAMAVALPNKQEKLELIVQKLTEIWISDIYFWAAERSVVKAISPQKFERLQKIVQEALEQSYGRKLPKLRFIENFDEIKHEYIFISFDLWGSKLQLGNSPLGQSLLWIVWPEWGLTQRDYDSFWKEVQVLQLGDSVLRMETASIVWAWFLSQQVK